MSNQPRGRGAPRGGERGGNVGRGGGRGRGDFQGGRGRGDFQGGRGRGDFQGGRGRGDFQGGRGGAYQGNRGDFRGDFRGGRGGGQGRGDGPEIFLNNDIVSLPNQDVEAAENERVKETRRKMIDGFPGRPGHGTQGKKIILRTNYFHIQSAYEVGRLNDVVGLHRYNISTPADTLSKPKKRRLVEMIAETMPFRGVDWATDYSSFFVTTKELPERDFKGTIEMRDANEPPFPPPQQGEASHVQQARRRRSKQYRIQHTNSFTLSQLVDSLRANGAGTFFAARGDIIQMLNVIIAKKANTTANVYNTSLNKFYPEKGHPLTQEINLGAGLRGLRGYYASVRTSTRRILLNLNVSSAAFYKAINLRALMNEFIGSDRLPRNAYDLSTLEAFLNHLRVETNYLKVHDANGKDKVDNNGQPVSARKTKSIFGFAKKPLFGNAKQVTFPTQDVTPPRNITVFDYFREAHGITLQYWQEPVLNVGTKKDPSYLPVELASVMPGQAVKRLLSGPQTAEMITFAARAPHLNAMSIAGTSTTPGNALLLMGLDASGQTSSVQPFGFRVANQMITVPGRILPTPQIRYGNNPMTPRFGSWNVAGQKFTRPGRFSGWGCLVINVNGRDALDSRNIKTQHVEVLTQEPLLTAFEAQLRNYGLTMGPRSKTMTVALPLVNPSNRPTINQALIENFEIANRVGNEVLLIVLREADKWLYSRIKFYGDVVYGIQTINVVGSKFQNPKNQPMYFGNVALKFNIKGGGAAHVIPEAEMSPLDNKTMLVGIDVTHPSPGSSEGSPSIAGVVASTDSRLCQWPGSLRCQTGRVEMVEGLTSMMMERLTLWRAHNQLLPDKIIIYRDGVSEGQYRTVLELELPPVQEAFKKMYGDKSKWPKVSIIVVGKRHHTRFYPTKAEDADQRSSNPLPGTVVDRGITDHFLWDFYLQAHQGLQGTARPAHYVVIMDEIGFEQNQLEAFTHKMCYLFNRATKAVSICPPAYYADLICERGRAYLYSTLNENQASGAAAYNATTAEWNSGVHNRLKNKTFYV